MFYFVFIDELQFVEYEWMNEWMNDFLLLITYSYLSISSIHITVKTLKIWQLTGVD